MSYILLTLTLLIGILQAENLFTKPVSGKSWLIVGLLIVSTIASFIIEHRKNKDEKNSSNTGVLESKKVAEEKGLIFELANNSWIKFPSERFDLMSLSKYMVGGDDKKKEEILNILKGIELEAHLENGKIMVNTTIRDADGTIVAEIINNNWKVNVNPIVWDRNFDDKALEVKNNSGQVVLFVEIIKNIVRLNGVFIKPDGSVAIVMPFKLPELGPDTETAVLMLGEPGKAKDLKDVKDLINIEPKFKYPSAAFPGQRKK